MAENSTFSSLDFNNLNAKNSDDIFSDYMNITTNNDLLFSQFNNNDNFFIKPEFNFLEKKIKKEEEEKNKKKIKIFNTEINNNISNADKNIINKRLKNKIAAKKFRTKKKKYIENLEKNLILYKNELKELKYNLNDIKKEKNYYLILKDYENKIQSNNNNNNNNYYIKEYILNQKILLYNFFSKNILFMIPIELKIFQNKFLKLENLNENDSYEILLNKINKNINILQELFSFNNNNNNINENKNNNENKIIKLFKFYKNLKDFVEAFVNNINLL